jgi:hypothetical protein
VLGLKAGIAGGMQSEHSEKSFLHFYWFCFVLFLKVDLHQGGKENQKSLSTGKENWVEPPKMILVKLVAILWKTSRGREQCTGSG